MLSRGLLLLSAVNVAAHGIMRTPEPRLDPDPSGTKHTPFSRARRDANRGCAGSGTVTPWNAITNQPQAAYPAGLTIPVQWELTIPHEIDNLETGVRIAIHYADDDSFDENILLGCLDGESNCGEKDAQDNYVNRVSAGSLSRIVSLPPGKTCNYCVLQWIWAAETDGGYYVSCADISITTDGNLPDFLLLTETDNDGDGLPDGIPGGAPSSGNGTGGGGSSSAGAAVAVIVVLLLLAGAGYYFYKKKQGGGAGTATSGAAAVGGLPPGWTAAVDPSSGRTYYVNSKTGETSWDKPGGGGMAALPPPAAPPAGGGLPPGWQSAIDPASGRTYYVNSVTGQTSWELPGRA